MQSVGGQWAVGGRSTLFAELVNTSISMSAPYSPDFNTLVTGYSGIWKIL